MLLALIEGIKPRGARCTAAKIQVGVATDAILGDGAAERVVEMAAAVMAEAVMEAATGVAVKEVAVRGAEKVVARVVEATAEAV
jgi:hypothetical protein